MKILIALLVGLAVPILLGGLVEAATSFSQPSADVLTVALNRAVSQMIDRLQWPVFRRYRNDLLALLQEIPFEAPLSVSGFFSAQLCALLASALVFGWIHPALGVMAAFITPVIGDQFLKHRRRKVHQEILRALPDCLELISLLMEAGVDLIGGIDLYLRRGAPSPLRTLFEEFRKENQMGVARVPALEHLSARTSYMPLRHLLKSIAHATTLGGSLAPLLREQSAAFRITRMQLAEKKAAEAPLKVLLPLFLFIFPTVFIVLFGPIFLLLMKGGF